MAQEWLPLLFFLPAPHADALEVAEGLVSGSTVMPVTPLEPARVLKSLKAIRGFGRLKINLPHFSLDNPRADAAFEGDALGTHLLVRFYGNFDKMAEPLFSALTGQGFRCYSLWDPKLVVT